MSKNLERFWAQRDKDDQEAMARIHSLRDRIVDEDSEEDDIAKKEEVITLPDDKIREAAGLDVKPEETKEETPEPETPEKK